MFNDNLMIIGKFTIKIFCYQSWESKGSNQRKLGTGNNAVYFGAANPAEEKCQNPDSFSHSSVAMTSS